MHDGAVLQMGTDHRYQSIDVQQLRSRRCCGFVRDCFADERRRNEKQKRRCERSGDESRPNRLGADRAAKTACAQTLAGGPEPGY